MNYRIKGRKYHIDHYMLLAPRDVEVVFNIGLQLYKRTSPSKFALPWRGEGCPPLALRSWSSGWYWYIHKDDQGVWDTVMVLEQPTPVPTLGRATIKVDKTTDVSTDTVTITSDAPTWLTSNNLRFA